MNRTSALVFVSGMMLAGPLPAPNSGSADSPGLRQGSDPREPVDTVVLKIKEEGFERSQVMEIASWLTGVHGPRLTGSPITKRAGDWVLDQFRKWGLANPHYEWWGPFGRGWVNQRMIAQVTSPVAFPVIAYPGAWTDRTNGMLRTNVVVVPSTVRTAPDFAPYRGKLRGKIVLSWPAPNPAPLFIAPAQRRDVPRVTVAAEHYGRIYRILEKGIPVRMDLEVKNTFYTTDLNSFNLIAELPGTDQADEIVMLGAHFASWHAGTGAADNAAGSAVMMEAMRILKASGVRLRRTVRVGLWTGEEQARRGVRERAFRRPCNRSAQAGARDGLGLLQPGQRHGRDPRHLPPGECGGSPDLRRLDAAPHQRQHQRGASGAGEHGRDRP